MQAKLLGTPCSFRTLPFLFGIAVLLGLLPVLNGHEAPMEVTPPSHSSKALISVIESITAAPPASQDLHPVSTHSQNTSAGGHGKHRKPFPVVGIQYKSVRVPFEIALWILLACLMKLGDGRENGGDMEDIWSWAKQILSPIHDLTGVVGRNS